MGETEFVVGAVTAGLVLLNTIVAWLAKGHARETNDAVNGRHKKQQRPDGPPPKLYDAVLGLVDDVREVNRQVAEISRWQAAIGDVPLDNRDRLAAYQVELTEMRHRIAQIHADVKRFGCPVALGNAGRCEDGSSNSNDSENLGQ